MASDRPDDVNAWDVAEGFGKVAGETQARLNAVSFVARALAMGWVVEFRGERLVPLDGRRRERPAGTVTTRDLRWRIPMDYEGHAPVDPDDNTAPVSEEQLRTIVDLLHGVV